MAHGRAARKAPEALGAEHVGHPSHRFLDVKRPALGGRDPGGLLAPVLERIEPEIREIRSLRMVEDAEEPALVVQLVVVEPDGLHWSPPPLTSPLSERPSACGASRADKVSIGCSSARA